MIGDLSLVKSRQLEGSEKVQYRVRRAYSRKFVGTPREDDVWVRTLFRLEWYPRLHTWRLMETRRGRSTRGNYDSGWVQVILADFGDIPEEEACALAIPTLLLMDPKFN